MEKNAKTGGWADLGLAGGARGGQKLALKIATFSQLMQRMCRAVYVDAERGGPTGQDPGECCYRLTDLGLIVWQTSRQFYARFADPPAGIPTTETIEAEFVDRPPSQRPILAKQKMSKVLRKAFMRKLKAMRR